MKGALLKKKGGVSPLTRFYFDSQLSSTQTLERFNTTDPATRTNRLGMRCQGTDTKRSLAIMNEVVVSYLYVFIASLFHSFAHNSKNCAVFVFGVRHLGHVFIRLHRSMSCFTSSLHQVNPAIHFAAVVAQHAPGSDVRV